jgi:hypothetical protein
MLQTSTRYYVVCQEEIGVFTVQPNFQYFAHSHIMLLLASYFRTVAYPGIFFVGGSKNSVRTEGRENGDLGAITP